MVAFERATGFEPAMSAWKADALPLGDARSRTPILTDTPQARKTHFSLPSLQAGAEKKTTNKD